MRKIKCMIFVCSCLLIVGTSLSTQAAGPDAEQRSMPEQKKYPHPHALHLSMMGQNMPDFTADDVQDWPKFVRVLQAKPAVLPLGREMTMMITALKPEELNGDDKKVIVNELNRILNERSKAGDSKSSRSDDQKWDTRQWITSKVPHLTQKNRGVQLGKMTCGTCHETHEQMTTAYMTKQGLTVFNEKTVLDCFSKAIAGEKGIDACVKMADALKRTRIAPYGPLRNFVQRPRKETEIPFFVAIHSENPYTFKPLLKRLVCVECHAFGRKLAKVTGIDGKVKDIPMFYGAGSGSHKKLVRQEQER